MITQRGGLEGRKEAQGGEDVCIFTDGSHCCTAVPAQHCKATVVVQPLSHARLCNYMDGSTLGFPVPHYSPEFAETHVHQVSDAIQPSRPLLPPPPALSLSQHQGLFS